MDLHDKIYTVLRLYLLSVRSLLMNEFFSLHINISVSSVSLPRVRQVVDSGSMHYCLAFNLTLSRACQKKTLATVFRLNSAIPGIDEALQTYCQSFNRSGTSYHWGPTLPWDHTTIGLFSTRLSALQITPLIPWSSNQVLIAFMLSLLPPRAPFRPI
jgi:hypothetical protein